MKSEMWRLATFCNLAIIKQLQFGFEHYISVYTQNPCLPLPFLPDKMHGNALVRHHMLIMAAEDEKKSLVMRFAAVFSCMKLTRFSSFFFFFFLHHSKTWSWKRGGFFFPNTSTILDLLTENEGMYVADLNRIKSVSFSSKWAFLDDYFSTQSLHQPLSSNWSPLFGKICGIHLH